MVTFNVQETKGYTIMPNHHLRNPNLSSKAKGILSFMLALPEDWDYSERGLAACFKDGRDGIRTGLKELEKEGYLVRQQMRGENGRVTGVKYCVFYVPQVKEADENTIQAPWSENPTTVEPTLEKPTKGEPTLENTPNKELNKLKNKKIFTNHINNQSLKEIEQIVKKQINYNWLKTLQGIDNQMLENVVDIFIELKSFASTASTIFVGKEIYPSELVKRKLEKISADHIQYVLECLKHHKKKINNIKAFLQKALLNAPDTIDSYYYAEVQHDFRHKG